MELFLQTHSASVFLENAVLVFLKAPMWAANVDIYNAEVKKDAHHLPEIHPSAKSPVKSQVLNSYDERTKISSKTLTKESTFSEKLLYC